MKQKFSIEEGFSKWDQWWSELETEFFKCEARNKYCVEDEQELLELFHNGKIEQVRREIERYVQPADSEWNELKRRNVPWRRVHVYTEPLSDYLRFELEAYRIQSRLEDIGMVHRDAINLKVPIPIPDFVLFDRKKACIIEYTESGVPCGVILLDSEEEQFKNLLLVQKHLLEIAIPLEKFLYIYDNS